MSILQFVQSVAVPQGALQKDNLATVAEILRFADYYSLFTVSARCMDEE